MSAQAIYTIREIEEEKVFDTLCEILEDYDVELVSPKPFDFSNATIGETELMIAGTEEILDELKEELEQMDLLESANLVDSFEDEFSEENDDEYLEDSL